MTALETFYETIEIDEFAKSQKTPLFVIPANAGIQGNQPLLDSRFHGNDGHGDFLRAIANSGIEALVPTSL